MKLIIVDIPRTGGNLCAKEVLERFKNLGWSHSSTGYLIQDVREHFPSKVRTYGFCWTKVEAPIYPDGIPYKQISA